MYERVKKVFEQAQNLAKYDYEIIYVDDRSPDTTWELIKKLCSEDPRVKGIRNLNNFGMCRNAFSALKQGSGDAVFLLMGDLQEPPEVLAEFVEQWEHGHKVVVGARTNAYANPVISFARSVYYKLMSKMTNNRILTGVNGFGLYDKSVVAILEDIVDIQPLLQGIISEFVSDVKVIPVKQEESLRGKSGLNFWGRYDIAMISITSYTKVLLRICSLVGVFIGVASIILALVMFIQKLLNWSDFSFGMAPLLMGMFFLFAITLFFLGVMGEYVLSISNKVQARPLVAIDEKLNFEEQRDERVGGANSEQNC
jgi:glycosyltransferase involved in cell wall biosynthesis